MYVTFREPEHEQLIDTTDEWKEICETLEMKGQKSLIERKSGEEGNPTPFMRINKRWLKIFKVLCPSKMEYKEYNFSVIPVEGMAEIAECVHNRYFDEIEIWYDNVEKDPLIIGINKGRYSSDNKYFLVGRFGDEIMPLEMLEKKAIKRMRDSIKNAIDKLSKTVDESLMNYLDDDSDTVVSFSQTHRSLYY